MRRAAIAVLALLGACESCESCERPKEETFEADLIAPGNFPLVVEAGPDVSMSSVRAAIKLWNEVGGCDLFVLGSPGDVRLDHDVPTPEMGDCWERCDPDRHVACTCFGVAGWRVFYPNRSTIDVDMWVWAHELGHVLGMAHDVGSRMSVMRPDSHNGPRDGVPILVTHADGNAVAAQYCDSR